MNYWLLKSEPDAFGIDDLAARPDKTEHWDGVRNYQARNFLRDDMKRGDLAFFYHSNCVEPAVVGIVEIARAGYPDHTAWDRSSKYYDPKSDPGKPRWFMVDVRLKRKFRRPVTLLEMRGVAALAGMKLLARGNRLSVMPVTPGEWETVLGLENQSSKTYRSGGTQT